MDARLLCRHHNFRRRKDGARQECDPSVRRADARRGGYDLTSGTTCQIALADLLDMNKVNVFE